MMLKNTLQIALVGDRITPIMSGALSSYLDSKKVILIAGGRFTEAANNIVPVLNTAGIKTEIIALKDPYSIEETRNLLLNLLIQYEDQQPLLNTSSGTRPMCMAAFEVFHEFGQSVFYINPLTDTLYWLHNPNLNPVELDHKMRLPAFMQAHGCSISSTLDRRGISKSLRDFTTRLTDNAIELAKPLSTLNWLAKTAEGSLVSAEMSSNQLEWDDLRSLLNELSRLDLLDIDGKQILFKNEQARFYANGGWLEDHVYACLYGLRSTTPTLQDVARSIEISRGNPNGERIYNELDVACLNSNQLHLIECKTKRFHSRPNPRAFDTPGADALYKLDSLKNLLGRISTHLMLVSYNNLSRWNKQRASDLGIQVITGQQLPRLKQHMQEWFDTGV